MAQPRPHGFAPLSTSWGAQIIADPARAIGRSILTTGVYDLAVSEALFRLISPRETVVDAGANVGYMTVLAATAVGTGGKVLSFEPHPELFAVLTRNIAAARRAGACGEVKAYQAAVGDEPGTAHLCLPPGFDKNDGLASIESQPSAVGRSLPVRMVTLDEVLGDAAVSLLKIDVEGYEPKVLKGSAHALSQRRVRHVIFEDHSIRNSEAARILRDAGYRVFSLGWSIRGPRVKPLGAGSQPSRNEAPSFIATLEPDEVLARCRPTGWATLGRRAKRSRTQQRTSVSSALTTGF